MFDNNLYNLMTQMVEEHKSLYRIKNMYKKDTKEWECLEFWKKLQKDKEDHIKELQGLIYSHLAKAMKKKMYYSVKEEKKAQKIKKNYYYGTKEKKVK
jgi:ADP-heptose:LPS heptosyltransferase